MDGKPIIYDSSTSKDLTIDNLISLFNSLGASRILYKQLSPMITAKINPTWLAI